MSKNNENKLVPRLRFPEFTNENWNRKTIDETCEILNNLRKPLTTNLREKGIYPYYGASGIIDYVKDYIFNERLLLIGEDGAKWLAYEKTAFIAEGKYWVNNHAHVLKPIGVVDTLLENYLVKLDISPFITGAAPPKLTLGKLKSIPVPIPENQKEQQKIAACLSSLDDVINAESKKLEVLKEHKKGLLQNLFPQEGETVPKLRFKEFEDSGEWVEKKLGQICKVQAGKFVSASEIKENYSDDLFPCYGGNGLRGYTKSNTHSGKYSLIGRQGALCGNVNLADGTFHATEHAVVVTPEKDVDTVWLYYMLRYLNLNQYATGQAQPGLSVTNLEKVELKIPKSIAEQQKVADTLSSIDNLINAQSQKIETLKLHKKGLLQGLFPDINEHNG